MSSSLDGAAFDRVAADYDEVAQSRLGVLLRGRVHKVLEPLISSGSRVLDVGCGTGIDSAWMASRGAIVTGIDVSPRMIDIAKKRVGPPALFVVRDLNQSSWAAELGQFEAAISNFGAVSCVDDLADFGEQLAQSVEVGGVAVLVPMGHVVPWEQMAGLIRGDLSRVRRRFAKEPTIEHGYPGVSVRYMSARQLSRRLGARWRLRHASALGWALPTYAQRRAVEMAPRIGAALASVDAVGARLAGLLAMGDHQIAVLERV